MAELEAEAAVVLEHVFSVEWLNPLRSQEKPHITPDNELWSSEGLCSCKNV